MGWGREGVGEGVGLSKKTAGEGLVGAGQAGGRENGYGADGSVGGTRAIEVGGEEGASKGAGERYPTTCDEVCARRGEALEQPCHACFLNYLTRPLPSPSRATIVNRHTPLPSRNFAPLIRAPPPARPLPPAPLVARALRRVLRPALRRPALLADVWVCGADFEGVAGLVCENCGSAFGVLDFLPLELDFPKN